jgi:TP901 family phage tail tape measure protein
MPRLDRLWYEIDSETKGFEEGIARSDQKLRAFTEYAKGHPLIVLGALGAAATVAGVKLAKMAADFERQMAKVQTVAQGSKQQLDDLANGVLATFQSLPVGSLDELTQGLYDIVSSGIEAGKSIEFLNVAAQGAIGGMTSVATSVDALTSIVNAYREQNLDATTAQDIMFQAVNKGKLSYEELAGSIGNVVGIAATMGISLEDLLAAVAQLTLGGIRASEAMNGVRQAITSILRPTEKFRELFPELAAEFNEGKLRGEGFVQFLLDLEKAARGNSKVFSTLFSDVDGYKVALALLKDQGVGVAAMQRELANAGGAAAAAAETMTNTSSALNQKLRNELTATLTELGNRTLPAYSAALKVAIGLTEFFAGRHYGADDIKQLVDGIKQFGIEDGSRLRDLMDVDRFDALSNSVKTLAEQFKKGGVDLKSFATHDLELLDHALQKIQQDYKYLGQTADPVHQAITQLLKDREAQARAEAEARKAALPERVQDIERTRDIGLQSADELTRARTEERKYSEALRQRAAALKEISRAQRQLNDAVTAARAAAARGDEAGVTEAKRQADAARAAIESQREALRIASDVIRAKEQETANAQRSLLEQARAAAAQATSSLVDDMEAQLGELEAAAKKAFGTEIPAAVTRMLDDLRARIAQRPALEKLVADFDALGPSIDHALSVLDKGFGRQAFTESLPALEQMIDRTKAQIAATKDGTEDHRVLVELLRKEEALWHKIAQHAGDLSDDSDRQRRAHTEQIRVLQEQAREIEAAARGAIQLAGAFGIVSDEAARALESIAQIGANLQAALAGDFSSILAVGGGLASLISSLTGPSPEEQRRREIIRENTEAIERLTQRVGEFGDINVAGSTFAGLSDAIASALSAEPTKQQIADLMRGPPQLFHDALERLQKELTSSTLDAALKSLGLSMADLKDVAQQLGITLDEKHLKESLQQLQQAIQATQIAQFALTFGSQLEALRAEFELFDITDPIQQLQKLVDLFNDPKFGAPALREALAGLDLTTPEGQAKAKKAVQALFRQLQAGTLTPEQLGGLTPQEFLQQLEEIKRLLDSGAAPGTGGYNIDRTITEATGSLIGGLLTTSNVWLQRITAATETMAQALAGAIQPLPTLYPPTVTTSTGAGAMGAAPVFNLTVNVTIAPGASVADAHAAGEEIGRKTIEAINRGMGQEIRRRGQLKGEVMFS